MQDVFAVTFLDRQFSRKPHTNSARHADRAERFVRKIQEQNSTRYQWNHLLKLLCLLDELNTNPDAIAICCASI
jgi:hypothetical protein